MSSLRWKLLAASFALLSLFQFYRSGTGPRRHSSGDEGGSERASSRSRSREAPDALGRGSRPEESNGVGDDDDDGEDEHWAPPPVGEHWAISFLRPKPGENLLDYRDRVLPVAQAAVAPFRAKVRDDLADFKEQAALTSEQEASLKEVLDRRSGAIQDRVMEAVFSGEFNGPLKPTSGLALARSLFNEVDGMHSDVLALLSEQQGEILRDSHFDVIEYLLFGTRWEDMLGVVSSP